MRRLELIGTALLLLLILGLSASAAFSSLPPQEPPTPTPLPLTEIRLSVQDDGRQVELSEGQLLVITLEGNPSTGYMWEVEEGSEKIVRQMGEVEFQPQSNLLGAPGKELLRFQAVGEGQTALKLVYHRPWEKGVEPAKTFSIQVQAVGPFTGVYTFSAAPTPAPEPPSESPSPVGEQPSLGTLPPSFNWCPGGGGYCTGVKDQLACGSCWAFGTVGPLESNIKRLDGFTKDLSEQYLLSCNNDGWNCDGGWWAHDYHLNNVPPGESDAGAVYESDFPYVASKVACGPAHTHYEKIDSWSCIGAGAAKPHCCTGSVLPTADIKQAIYDHGPVSVAVCAGLPESQFQYYTGGVFEYDESSDCGLDKVNHAVVLVGWDDTQGTSGVWYLRNSWGIGWGENGGYMRIGYGISNVGSCANYINYSPSIPLTNTVYLPLVLKGYPPPTGWITIISEDFEGSFPGSWTVLDNESGSGEYYWGQRNCRPYQGTYSGWGVGGGAQGGALVCNSNYPNYTQGWMIYGPFSLVGATAADLQFKLWQYTELTYDRICRMASTDGNNFSGYCSSGNSGGWTDMTLDLASYTGQPNVWVALIFDSDYMINYAEGGYVDNIVLRKYVGIGAPPAAVGVEPVLPEGAQIVDTPATFVLKP